MEIHKIICIYFNFPFLMYKFDISNQSFIKIIHFDFPAIRNPAKISINPDAKSENFSAGMIFLTDIGIVKIPNQIISVKGNQHIAITNGYIARH
ncbi:MAG: hypothetical protein BWY69_00767 [Planctomycetes bacterium ADurb.Bin401]|nr:MAG: hypothetical protein BWY69_00767 [Planctomycetes bacterium ADurb.Bin401]